MTYRSITTVNADVARRWFQAEGEGIVWAVVDSGIDGQHQHFARHLNLELAAPLQHRDFTTADGDGGALIDEHGHGTHVAAIIAGEMLSTEGPMIALERERDVEQSVNKLYPRTLTAISGMSPRTKLLSLKVLDEKGVGPASNIIAALDYIQNLNQFGRLLRVHGVNLSLGYGWEPQWFACGES